MIYRDNLITDLKSYFGNDNKRINHALTVLKFAESILERESGNSDTVIPAAILHDIGIKESEKKYNSSAGNYQEIEGPPIARNILHKFNLEDNAVNEICDIIAHHHTPDVIDILNFNVIWDADLITNLIEEGITVDKKKIDRIFKTDEGKKIAEKELLKKEK
jgi:hypothetical protein